MLRLHTVGAQSKLQLASWTAYGDPQDCAMTSMALTSSLRQCSTPASAAFPRMRVHMPLSLCGCGMSCCVSILNIECHHDADWNASIASRLLDGGVCSQVVHKESILGIGALEGAHAFQHAARSYAMTCQVSGLDLKVVSHADIDASPCMQPFADLSLISDDRHAYNC